MCSSVDAYNIIVASCDNTWAHVIHWMQLTMLFGTFPVPSYTASLKSSQCVSEQTRVSTTAWSPSHKRGSHGSNKKDQRNEHRILHHTARTSLPASNHSLQKDRFEDEVAGSLDLALKQLLSDSWYPSVWAVFLLFSISFPTFITSYHSLCHGNHEIWRKHTKILKDLTQHNENNLNL